jgi:hypothetical protein
MLIGDDLRFFCVIADHSSLAETARVFLCAAPAYLAEHGILPVLPTYATILALPSGQAFVKAP